MLAAGLVVCFSCRAQGAHTCGDADGLKPQEAAGRNRGGSRGVCCSCRMGRASAAVRKGHSMLRCTRPKKKS